MSTQPTKATAPAPFPEGWYFIESRKAIEKAGLLQKTWLGEQIVAWCDEDGRICVAESVCPHLGSELGPEAGGRICDGRLVCPFHGFEFDATGQCVATPFAAPPRSARLRVFETEEIAGMIFAWWGLERRPPQWSVPDEATDQEGWSDIRIQTLRFPGHPQETSENSVDIAHLRYVHGYDNVDRTHPVEADGPLFVSRWDFRTVRKIAGIARLTLDLSANTRIFGLGYSLVQVREHSIPMDMRLWILATPVDGRLIDLSLASQVRVEPKTRRLIAGAGFLPHRLRATVVNRFLSPMQKVDVLQDVVIWSRKQYRARPRLNRADGEIMAFRDYCRQFYPDPASADDPFPPPERAGQPRDVALGLPETPAVEDAPVVVE